MACYQDRIKRMQNLARVKALARAAARLTGQPQAVYQGKDCYEFTTIEDADSKHLQYEKVN